MLWHESMYSNSLLSRSSVIDTNFKNNARKENYRCSSACVLLICCCEGEKTWPEAIHGRKFILAYGYRGIRLHHGWEVWQQATHMRTKAGSWEIISSDPSRSRKQASWKWHKAFNSQRPLAMTFFLQQAMLLNLPDSTTNWGPSVQISEPMGDIFIPTT